MKLIASWTEMIAEDGWIHHWKVRAPCMQQALEYIEEKMALPDYPSQGLWHRSPAGWRWKGGGYVIIQVGGLIDES